MRSPGGGRRRQTVGPDRGAGPLQHGGRQRGSLIRLQADHRARSGRGRLLQPCLVAAPGGPARQGLAQEAERPGAADGQAERATGEGQARDAGGAQEQVGGVRPEEAAQAIPNSGEGFEDADHAGRDNGTGRADRRPRTPGEPPGAEQPEPEGGADCAGRALDQPLRVERMGRAILTGEGRRLQDGDVRGQLLYPERVPVELHQHAAGELARARAHDAWVALEAFDDTASQVWVAVQSAHGDARASDPPAPLRQYRRGGLPRGRGRRCIVGRAGRTEGQRADRGEDGLLVGRGRVEADQGIAGERVDLGGLHPSQPAQPCLYPAPPLARPPGQVDPHSARERMDNAWFRDDRAHGIPRVPSSRGLGPAAAPMTLRPSALSGVWRRMFNGARFSAPSPAPARRS